MLSPFLKLTPYRFLRHRFRHRLGNRSRRPRTHRPSQNRFLPLPSGEIRESSNNRDDARRHERGLQIEEDLRYQRRMWRVEQGRVKKEIMSRARIDERDVLVAARETHGLERMDQIKYAVLETSGAISVIPR